MFGGSCLTLEFWFKVCVLIIFAIALWRLMMLFLPMLQSKLPTLVVQIINIVVWAGIALLCLVVIFFFLSCIWGLVAGTFGGGSHPFRSGDLGTFFSAAASGMSLYRPRHGRLLGYST